MYRGRYYKMLSIYPQKAPIVQQNYLFNVQKWHGFYGELAHEAKHGGT